MDSAVCRLPVAAMCHAPLLLYATFSSCPFSPKDRNLRFRCNRDALQTAESRTLRQKAMYENLMEDVVSPENVEKALQARDSIIRPDAVRLCGSTASAFGTR